MKVTIIGCGYVGTVTGACFAELGNEVIFYDINRNKIEAIKNYEPLLFEPGLNSLVYNNRNRIQTTNNLEFAIQSSDMTFICVGTPSKKDGEIDLQFILSACKSIGKAIAAVDNYTHIIIKSTVFPGTTDSLIRTELEKASGKVVDMDFGLGVNPEFLREGTALNDFFKPDRIIIGSNQSLTKDVMQKLYSNFKCPIFETDNRTAEMVKYCSNAYLATRISFANEIGNFSKYLGIDSREVFEGVGMDSRIGPDFFKTGIGFGGSCFPKDVRALVKGAEQFGFDLSILRETIKINDQQPLQLIKLLLKHLPTIHGIRIGVLGLAFKPETDDIRESRAIPVIEKLIELGAQPVVYDPKAMISFKELFPDIEYANGVEDVLTADAILIITEWEEFEDIDYRGKMVIDGRLIKKAREEATTYEGVCW